MKKIIYLISLFICFSLGFAQSMPDSAYEYQGLEKLTSLLNLKPSDIHFRDDYTEKDKFRLARVAELMDQPYGMISFTESLKNSCVKTNPSRILNFAYQNLALENPAFEGKIKIKTGGGREPTVPGMFYNSIELLLSVFP